MLMYIVNFPGGGGVGLQDAVCNNGILFPYPPTNIFCPCAPLSTVREMPCNLPKASVSFPAEQG